MPKLDDPPSTRLPALLVAYPYLSAFLDNRPRYAYRNWALDSGAFSAFNSGVTIDLQQYTEICQVLLENDPTLTEVFALDVIGDWRASLKNAEAMWAKGIPAIPTFHESEPWDVLKGIAKDYDKIAIGGCVGSRTRDKFAGQCFARVWPKKIHGFGFGTRKAILSFPWHSVDATSWEVAPCRYGRWNAFGNRGGREDAISVRGSSQNLRIEVEWYLDLEEEARKRWAKEMAKLQTQGPAVRLSLVATARGRADNDKSPFLKGNSDV